MSVVSGILQQYWLKRETVFDTAIANVATDAIKLESLELSPSKEWIESEQASGTASPQTEHEGKEGGEWTAACRIAPVAAGTPPAFGPVLKAAFGVETIVGATSVKYELTDDPAAADSLQWVKKAGNNFYEIANGAWVNQLVIEILNGQPTKITASGGFASYGYLRGAPKVEGAHLATDDTIALEAGHGRLVRRNALIKFGAEDNAGAGYRVTAVDRATNVVTISPALAAGISDGAAVLPVVPSQTFAGKIIPGLNHGLTLAGVAMGIIQHKVTLGTGVQALDNESQSNRPTRIFRTAKRPVQVETQLYLLDENAHVAGLGWEGDKIAVVGRAGPDIANRRMTVDTPAVRYDVTPLSPANAEVTTYSATGPAQQAVVAKDELAILFS